MEQMVSIFWAEPEWIIPPTDDTATPATALKTPNLIWAKVFVCRVIFFPLLQILDWHILMDVLGVFLTDCKMRKMRKSVEKETLEKEKSPPTCLPFALVLLSLRSPHCDDLWFTFVNKLLLCVTFCFYSSLAYRLVILDVLSLRGQLHSDLPVRLNKSWQSIFCGTFPESIQGIIHFKKKYNKDSPPEYFLPNSGVHILIRLSF